MMAQKNLIASLFAIGYNSQSLFIRARVVEWQTRYFEGVVGKPVRVQLSYRA